MSGLCRACDCNGLPQKETAMSSNNKEARLPVCSPMPEQPESRIESGRQSRSGRREKRAASAAAHAGNYREDAQTTEAARHSQFRSKKSRRARAEEARMDGMDTTIQNADDMDVDGDNFPLDIDHDGTLVLSAPACCMRHC